jgi:hypothetical protein
MDDPVNSKALAVAQGPWGLYRMDTGKERQVGTYRAYRGTGVIPRTLAGALGAVPTFPGTAKGGGGEERGLSFSAASAKREGVSHLAPAKRTIRPSRPPRPIRHGDFIRYKWWDGTRGTCLHWHLYGACMRLGHGWPPPPPPPPPPEIHVLPSPGSPGAHWRYLMKAVPLDRFELTVTRDPWPVSSRLVMW